MDDFVKHFLDVCLKAIAGSITPEDASEQLTKIVETHATKDRASSLFDALEMIDAALGSVASDGDQRRKLISYLKKIGESVLPDEVLKVNIDCMNDDTTVNTRFVKTKTKLFFKQLKFNLLREESEGYAKLITELSQYHQEESPPELLNRVRCLIGQFNLDPNRSLDIMLECFEAALDGPAANHSKAVSFYIELLRQYRPNNDELCHIVGFKFTFYTSKRAAAVAVSAPSALYNVAAQLISHGLIDLTELCYYLSPKLDPMLAEHKESLEAVNTRAKTLSKSSLGMDWDSVESESNNGEQTQPLTSSNQKLGLTQALLNINAWKEAKHMLDRLPEFYAVRHAEVAATLCKMINSMIETAYRRHCSEYCVALDDYTGVSSSQEDNLLETFVQDVLPIVSYLGPNLSQNSVLLTKLVRLCHAVYTYCQSHPGSAIEVTSLLEVCEDVLLPSLCCLRSNCAIAEELWALISLFSYPMRFRMYGRLKTELEKRHPWLIIAKGETVGKTRYIMKRVSKETTKTNGRQLGKLTHCFPTGVFDYILNQIQQFENLIGPVVDSLKYLTNLSYDSLAFCIIEHLASPEKEKLKVSDATLSPWLQSLATFVGSVCKKYNMELMGILQYVANQLKSGKSFDLLVLREIIENMSGVETTTNLTSDQLDALSGGDTLRSEAGNFGQVRNTKRSANRLKDALLQEDLVVSLCILMAQQRGCIVFNEGATLHLKLTGQMLDQCQETLVQFGNFLASSLKAEDYVKRMPSAPELISAYNLTPDTAMFLSRPAYSYKILAKYEELKKLDRANKATINADRKVIDERKAQHYKAACDAILGPLTTELSQVLPDSHWQDIGSRLFTTFWMLSMYDLHIPMAAYNREIERVKRLAQQPDESREISDAKRRKEKERYQQVENKLVEEQRRQQEHVTRVLARLGEERSHWFPPKAARNASIGQFLQLCVLPRICLSDVDALFSAKFIHTLHQIGTPSFSTLICYDRIFCEVAPVLFSLTENEANHYGRFLCAALEIIMHWHKHQDAFDKECAGFPGFITRFKNASSGSEESSKEKDIVDYENFRHVVHKWHFKLTKTLMMALSSGFYVPVRNALLILIKILPYFPVLKQFAQAIEKKVVQIRDDEKEKRQDLHVLAASYWGHLKVRKTPTANEADFHIVNAKDKELIKARVAAMSDTKQLPQSKPNVSANQAQAQVGTSLDKKKQENGVANATAVTAARAATPTKLQNSTAAATSRNKVSLRKETTVAAASSAPSQSANVQKSQQPTEPLTSAEPNSGTNAKRPSESPVEKRAKPLPAPSVDVQKNGGAATTGSKVVRTVVATSAAPTTSTAAAPSAASGNVDGEPKSKKSKPNDKAAEATALDGDAKNHQKPIDSPKRSSRKPEKPEKVEEPEPKTKRRKVEDQSPRTERNEGSSPATASNRREESTERRHNNVASSNDAGKDRDRDRSSRTAAHASGGAADKSDKKNAENTTKGERSPKTTGQTQVSSLSKKRDSEDGKSTPNSDKISVDKRKIRLSGTKRDSSTTSNISTPEKGKHSASSTRKDDDRRSSRNRKD